MSPDWEEEAKFLAQADQRREVTIREIVAHLQRTTQFASYSAADQNTIEDAIRTAYIAGRVDHAVYHRR